MQEIPQHIVFQKRALASLSKKKGAIVFSYGAGKTRVALEYAVKLQNTQHNLTAVVLCKNRNMVTWAAEIAKWLPNYKVYFSFPSEKMVSDGIWIIPYHLLFKNLSTVIATIQKYKPAVLIGDEITTIKNIKAQVTTAVLDIAATARKIGTICVSLTGNPMPERETEIWTQYNFLYGDVNPLGKTYYQFLRKWFVMSDIGMQLELQLRNEFMRIVRDNCIYLTDADKFLLRQKTGIKEVEYRIEHYELSKEQTYMCAQLRKTWSLCGMFFDYAFTIVEKANQICSGFYYDEDGNTTYLEDSPKLNLLMAIVEKLLDENPDRKIVVWSALIAERKKIKEAFDKRKIGLAIGPVSYALEAFQNRLNSIRAIIMPLGTPEGFNELRVADTNIFFSNVYSQEKRNQAEARIDRLGQLAETIQHIDLCAKDGPDTDIVIALQGKALSEERLNTIVDAFFPEPKKRKGKKDARRKT